MDEPSDDIRNWAQKIAQMQDTGATQTEIDKIEIQFYKEAFDRAMDLLKESQSVTADLVKQLHKIKEKHEKFYLEIEKTRSN
tara:strand:- start:778 stop:1023 length:246 start_codon:yes stop_codon:yes gene_type:complete